MGESIGWFAPRSSRRTRSRPVGGRRWSRTLVAGDGRRRMSVRRAAGLLDASTTVDALFPPLVDPRRAPQPFQTAPGGSFHHDHPGGLAEHTAFNLEGRAHPRSPRPRTLRHPGAGSRSRGRRARPTRRDEAVCAPVAKQRALSLSRFRGPRFYAALDAESKRNSYSMGLRYSLLECRRLRDRESISRPRTFGSVGIFRGHGAES
jgi:hypothetical protein